MKKIDLINDSIIEWFDKNKGMDKIQAKELMPLFIKNNVFKSNQKDGLPIRQVLRKLDEEKQLHLIPSVFPERKQKNTNWYFIRKNDSRFVPPTIISEKKQENKNNLASVSQSFPAMINASSHTLILGTLPGKESLIKNQYYANPLNAFWRIMDGLYKGQPTNYEERCDWLLKNGIALWDVTKHAERATSLDSDIKNEVANDFESFYAQFPNIKKVCFNGTKAQKIYKKHVGLYTDRNFYLLPSTSSAHTIPLLRKIEGWKNILTP